MYIGMNQLVGVNGPFESVLHIGAHHGEEGQDYQNSGVKSVVWVEANPKMMDALIRSTSGLALRQHYLNCCLSDVEGEEVDFFVANNGQSSSLLQLGTHQEMYPHIYYENQLKLKTRRMDDVLVEEADKGFVDPEKISLINLDVQGAELKVLKGCRNLLSSENLKGIYTEVNFEHVYRDCCLVEELDEYLIQFGFERAITAAPERTWGDAYYRKVQKS